MFGSLTRRLPRLGKWPRLALAACCLLLALDSALTAHARATASRQGTVPVVVATHLLGAGTRLRASDVRLAHWPRAARAAADVRQLGGAVGHQVVIATARGEAISSTRLLGRDLAAGLPADQVAVPVRLADPQAGSLIHAGDRVQLYAVARASDGFDTTPPASSTSRAALLGADLRVLAVLPGRADGAADGSDGVELVVAAPRSTALLVTRAGVSQIIAAMAEPP